MRSVSKDKSRAFPLETKGARKSVPFSLVKDVNASSLDVLGSKGRSDMEPSFEICFDGNCTTLTVEDLTQAIKNGIDRDGMPDEQARSMAQHVLNFFGYSERIIDNILEPEDRDAFYQLEDTGILTTEREETTLYDGREWRIHYWLFRKERIYQLINANAIMDHIADDSLACYQDPENWQRSK
ncbi:MAG: hypothetical protein NT131_00655 [Methanomassiliicoccales archaeon]|nr:hypothetical protein [Methanomassiliicoccales archaeon]